MANISEILFVNTTDPEQSNSRTCIDEDYYFVKYAFPLFWLAFFTTNDIQKCETREEDKYYYFIATKDKCIEVFRSRLPFLNQRFQGHLDELANNFIRFVEEKECRYIIVRLDEILGLELDPDTDEAKAEMIRQLSIFDDPSAESDWYPLSLETLYYDCRDALDGFGSEILPVPSFDSWLEQHYPDPVVKVHPKEGSKLIIVLGVLLSLAAAIVGCWYLGFWSF